MSFDLWLAFAAASTVVLLIPGPTVLLVCAYALSAGRRTGLWTVFGVALGDLAAITASVLGLGALLLSSAELFQLLRYLGAAYLIYLGLKLWRAPDSLADEAAGAVVSGPKMALHAFAVTATNPKSILFFVAFLPQFLDPAAALGPQLAAMAATFVGLATLNAAAYVLIAAQARRRLTRPGALKWVNRAGGVGLIGMGLAAAFAKRG